MSTMWRHRQWRGTERLKGLKTIDRNMLKVNSLYIPCALMNPKSELEEPLQINTLLRIWEICNANGFRTFQHTYVTVQFRQAWDALKEKEKLLKYGGAIEFLWDRDTARKNLWYSTILDKEFYANKWNNINILDSLRSTFERLYTALSQ